MVTKSTIIHGVLLGVNSYRVVVKTVVNPETLLPIPIDEKIVYIKDVVDIMVP